jgi:hypothetical protein
MPIGNTPRRFVAGSRSGLRVQRLEHEPEQEPQRDRYENRNDYQYPEPHGHSFITLAGA